MHILFSVFSLNKLTYLLNFTTFINASIYKPGNTHVSFTSNTEGDSTMGDYFSFGDCAICSATKAASARGRSLSESELRQAFRAQEQKQQASVQKRAEPHVSPRKNTKPAA